MRPLFFACFIVCCSSFSFSQNTIKLDIIEIEKAPKSLLLIENSKFQTLKTSSSYSLELNDHLKNISFMDSKIGVFSGETNLLSLENFKLGGFENYNINYRRSELKRLLPTPPTAIDFCPNFAN